jgi:hypothetical protein
MLLQSDPLRRATDPKVNERRDLTPTILGLAAAQIYYLHSCVTKITAPSAVLWFDLVR